jgi:hypothetical protein
VKKLDDKRQRPGLQRGFDSLTQHDDTEKVAQVIKRLTGRQQVVPAAPEPPSAVLPVPQELSHLEAVRPRPTGVKSTGVKSTGVKITSVIIEANYYKVPNDISDVLTSLQTPTEQAIYHRLYRLSYGYNQNVCRVGMHALAKATNIASKKTIATAIVGLIKKGHIAIVQEAGSDIRGTWYRIFLPEEIEEIRKITPVKNSAVKITPVKNSAVDFSNDHIKNSAVKITPVEQTIENKSTEITTTKNSAVDFASITTNVLQTLSLPKIIDHFYELLHQHPSQRKRERGITEGTKLLQEGFTLADLDYAISWVVRKYPDTKAFDRISYFIDQALKEREAEKRTLEVQQQQMLADKQKQVEQQQTEDEQKRLEDIKNILEPPILAALSEEAKTLVAQRHPNITVGQELLVRHKVDELIKERYWIGYNPNG